MHRTQVLLEIEQYRALQQMASQTGKSMGRIIREFVDLGLKRKRQARKERSNTLGNLKGFIKDADTTGRDHDRVLYGGD